MKCKYAAIHGSIEHPTVLCSVINEMVGLSAGMRATACERCGYVDGDDSFVCKMAKAHIRNLLISGNGRTNFADTVDVPAMTARFKPMSTEDERKEIVRKAVMYQCIPPEKGGHDAATIEKNLKELERELDVPGTLEMAL